MGIEFKALEKSDYKRVERLFGQLDRDHVDYAPFFFREHDGAAIEVADYETMLREKRSIGAFDGDVLAGIVVFKHIEQPAKGCNRERNFIYVDTLIVDNEIHRKGMGSRLLACLEDKAKRLGAERIEFDVWINNGPALEFYAGKGFKPTRQKMGKALI